MWPLSEEAVCRLKKGKGKREVEFDFFGHSRCLFPCHSLRPTLSLFCDCLLLCVSVPDSLSVCIPHPSPPSLSVAGCRVWPPSLSLSLSLCHVCNLNCGTAKQGWATRKAFHKISLSLWSLPGPCSVRNEMGAAHSHFPLCTASFQPVLSIRLQHSLTVFTPLLSPVLIRLFSPFYMRPCMLWLFLNPEYTFNLSLC